MIAYTNINLKRATFKKISTIRRYTVMLCVTVRNRNVVLFTPSEVLKRASTGSRALPGAVRRVYSGVSARIMRRKEYTDLGVLPHDNPDSRNVPRDHVKRTVMRTYTSYLL